MYLLARRQVFERPAYLIDSLRMHPRKCNVTISILQVWTHKKQIGTWHFDTRWYWRAEIRENTHLQKCCHKHDNLAITPPQKYHTSFFVAFERFLFVFCSRFKLRRLFCCAFGEMEPRRFLPSNETENCVPRRAMLDGLNNSIHKTNQMRISSACSGLVRSEI